MARNKKPQKKQSSEPLAERTVRVDDFATRNDNPDATRIVYGSKQISDVEGNVGNPLRVVDSLESLYKKGKLSASHYDAGKKFSMDFAKASLVGMRCVDWLGSYGGSSRGPADATHQARDRVWSALTALGSPGSGAAWHVLGLGETIKEYAAYAQQANGRSLDPMEATGIFRGACGNLAAHYKLEN